MLQSLTKTCSFWEETSQTITDNLQMLWCSNKGKSQTFWYFVAACTYKGGCSYISQAPLKPWFSIYLCPNHLVKFLFAWGSQSEWRRDLISDAWTRWLHEYNRSTLRITAKAFILSYLICFLFWNNYGYLHWAYFNFEVQTHFKSILNTDNAEVFPFHFSILSPTILLRDICSTERTGTAKPSRYICYLYKHLSGFLTKAIRCISLPWVLLRGFMIYKNKQCDWSMMWPLFVFCVCSTRTNVTTLGSNTSTIHKDSCSTFLLYLPFHKNQYE